MDLFVVNQSECESLSGIYTTDEASQELALEFFAKHGCDVIITLGNNGSVTFICGVRYDLKA